MVVTPFCSKSPTCAASSTVFPDGAERKSGRNRQSHYQSKWDLQPYSVPNSNLFACAVLNRAGVRLTKQQFLVVGTASLSLAGPIGLQSCTDLGNG